MTVESLTRLTRGRAASPYAQESDKMSMTIKTNAKSFLYI
jgi:hypothetical protein